MMPPVSLFHKLEQLSQRSGFSRGQAFEDWLTAMVCAPAAETKEDEYLAMIECHKRGEVGRRGADLMPQMFAELVDTMSREDVDFLGDLFQGAVTYGESGQYFSPATIAELLWYDDEWNQSMRHIASFLVWLCNVLRTDEN